VSQEWPRFAPKKPWLHLAKANTQERRMPSQKAWFHREKYTGMLRGTAVAQTPVYDRPTICATVRALG